MIEQILVRRREAVLTRWLNLILESYPEDSRKFFREKKDQFANPVGVTFSRETAVILDGLLEQAGAEHFYPAIDAIVRIRAVQEVSPALVVEAVFHLKKAVIATLAEEPEDRCSVAELLEFMDRIDRLSLLAFEVYVNCREQMNRIRIEEIKNRTGRLLERFTLPPDEDEAPDCPSCGGGCTEH